MTNKQAAIVTKKIAHKSLTLMNWVSGSPDIAKVELNDGRIVWISWGNNHEEQFGRVEGQERVKIEHSDFYEQIIPDHYAEKLLEIHTWTDHLQTA